MPRKVCELRADLRREGFYVLRQAGSHETWSHLEASDLRITVSGNDGDDAKPYQERQVQGKLVALRERLNRERPS